MLKGYRDEALQPGFMYALQNKNSFILFYRLLESSSTHCIFVVHMLEAGAVSSGGGLFQLALSSH